MPDPKPVPNPKDQPAAPFVIEAPPEEEFWERYNRRLEFPLAAVGAVLFHVFVLVGLVWGLLSLMSGEKKPDPNQKLMVVYGIDDTGLGSPGDGGDENKEADPAAKLDASVKQALPTPQALAEAREKIHNVVLPDAGANLPPIAPSNAAGLNQLNEELLKKVMERGGPGTGGTGKGGVGADSTQARGLRWVLRFTYNSEEEYVSQLAALGAEILVPKSPSSKDGILVPNLRQPGVHKEMTEADWDRVRQKLQMWNQSQDAVGVLRVLGVRARVQTFGAFFPATMQQELAIMERDALVDVRKVGSHRVTHRGQTATVGLGGLTNDDIQETRMSYARGGFRFDSIKVLVKAQIAGEAVRVSLTFARGGEGMQVTKVEVN